MICLNFLRTSRSASTREISSNLARPTWGATRRKFSTRWPHFQVSWLLLATLKLNFFLFQTLLEGVGLPMSLSSPAPRPQSLHTITFRREAVSRTPFPPTRSNPQTRKKRRATWHAARPTPPVPLPSLPWSALAPRTSSVPPPSPQLGAPTKWLCPQRPPATWWLHPPPPPDPPLSRSAPRRAAWARPPTRRAASSPPATMSMAPRCAWCVPARSNPAATLQCSCRSPWDSPAMTTSPAAVAPPPCPKQSSHRGYSHWCHRQPPYLSRLRYCLQWYTQQHTRQRL